jgi:site-specific recombinase XerD
MRHSKAMPLNQAGVNFKYIRNLLGHVNITTTDIYARTDTESKRKILKNIYIHIIPNNLSDWNDDEELINFFKK